MLEIMSAILTVFGMITILWFIYFSLEWYDRYIKGRRKEGFYPKQ